MYKCPYCKKDMQDACTCTANRIVIFPDGALIPSISFKADVSERCGDCGVRGGGYHHPTCDQEICPKCGKQLLSCGHSFDVAGNFVVERLP
jgi:hypothetical protein